MSGVASQVGQTVGAALLASGHIAAALPWLWRSDDSHAMQHIAGRLQEGSAGRGALLQGGGCDIHPAVKAPPP